MEDGNIPAAFVPGLKLKAQQLKYFILILSLYYGPQIVYTMYDIVTVAVNGSIDEYQDTKFSLALEAFDLVNFSILLWVFRTRKVWPEFFGLGINQMFERNVGNN